MAISNISGISSIQWNDFHDTSLSATQIAAVKHDITYANSVPNTAKLIADALTRNGVNEAMSLNDYMAQYANNEINRFATLIPESEIYSYMATQPNGTVFSYMDANGNLRWLAKYWDGTVFNPVTWAAGATYSSITSRFAGWGLTNVQTATTASYMEKVNEVLGTRYTATTKLTKEEWNTLSMRLQDGLNDWAAGKASKLAVDQGGGIKYQDGKWFVNGQAYNFMEVYTAVRVNTLYNINTQNATLLDRMQKRNLLINKANYLLSQINAILPTNTTDSITHEKVTALRTTFQQKYQTTEDPFLLFMPVAWAPVRATDSFKQTQMQTWITEIQSYITTQQTENSTSQAYLQELTNKQSETTDSLSNMVKANSNQVAEIARNFSSV